MGKSPKLRVLGGALIVMSGACTPAKMRTLLAGNQVSPGGQSIGLAQSCHTGDLTGPSTPPAAGVWQNPPTLGNQLPPPQPPTCPSPAATPIAHWDIVPFREFNGVINVGVVAAHHLGVQKVQFWYTQGANFSDPPQVTVTERSINPQNIPTRNWGAQQAIPAVPVREYWFPLDADSLIPNVPVRIKAVVVPNAGCPTKTVLSPADSPMPGEALDFITLTPSPTARQVYYADQSAPSTNTLCNATSKCQSIAKVFERISAVAPQNQGMAATLGRAEIRLGPGDWDLFGFESEAFSVAGQDRWLTFTSDPAVAPRQVRMRPGNLGWSVQLTSFQRMVMKEPATSTRLFLGVNNPNTRAHRRYIWLNQVGIVGDCLAPIANGEGWDPVSSQTFIGSYLTDSFMDYTVSGPRNLTLVQHVYAHRTGDGHASGSQTVVNYTLHTSYGGYFPFGDLEPGLEEGPDYHGDYYQGWGRQSNIVIQGGRYNPGGYLYLRGIVGTSPAIHRDIAIVDTFLDSTVSVDQANQWVFSFCASAGNGTSSGAILDHFVVVDSGMVGSNAICGESPNGGTANFNAANYRHMGFHNSRWGGSAATLTSTPPLPWNIPSVYVFPTP